jgi:hypothetical protein
VLIFFKNRFHLVTERGGSPSALSTTAAAASVRHAAVFVTPTFKHGLNQGSKQFKHQCAKRVARGTADRGRDKDMPYKYEPRKGEVETVARVITRAMGLDPDEPAAPALLAADGVRSQGA